MVIYDIEYVGKIAHLQIGAEEKQYGDILDDFVVKNYCDKFDNAGDIGEKLGHKLGHPSICG